MSKESAPMTFNPSPITTGRSAIALHDDDGRLVATLYAQATGMEIVAEPGNELTTVTHSGTALERLQVEITRWQEPPS